MKTKEVITALVFILTSLVVYSFFPTNGSFQSVIATLVFFVMLPLLFNRIILKKELRFFNLGVGDRRTGLILSAYSLLIVGFIFIGLTYFLDFINSYTVPTFITESFVNFLFYEFIILAPFVVIYEFYFRGFLMSILGCKFKDWAILLQALIFLILVVGTANVGFIQFVPYLIFAPFAGFISYKSKSLLYSGVSQFIVLLILNLIIIRNAG